MDKFASPWDSSSRNSKLSRPMALSWWVVGGRKKKLNIFIRASRQQVDTATFNVGGYFEVERSKKGREREHEREAWSRLKHYGFVIRPLASGALWRCECSQLVGRLPGCSDEVDYATSVKAPKCYPHGGACHRRITGIPGSCSAIPVMWRAEPEPLSDWFQGRKLCRIGPITRQRRGGAWYCKVLK